MTPETGTQLLGGRGPKALNVISVSLDPAKRTEQSQWGRKQWEMSQREEEETSCRGRENTLTLRKVGSHKKVCSVPKRVDPIEDRVELARVIQLVGAVGVQVVSMFRSGFLNQAS